MSRTSPADLLARLASLGIAHETHGHRAVFTVAESAPVKAAIPGAHTKNLFLKDKKGALFLVTAKDDTRIDLKRLHETLGASGRLSFGSGELLVEVLGVEPGSVTPFGAVNDEPARVRVILDRRLMGFERVNVHPLVNTMTTGLSPADLVAFLRATGHEPAILALPAPAEAAD
ncbi:prolyl-tRNA synthetase associated domain-containing protein [Enterovirga sp.]|uniref:prolyl-tRNA synthetase associated domain-containing protein n=1 Tax=Enterovirga sp. TaxID=2026350 RepID=UPI002C44768B|nr:prolyl-tRNA synthetase associated domain-containing protein [Enterovirga sp.]HMO30909.1 prolyl-tRNA synthetase associated domain-containing protein [Enterovirga sp.]